MEEERVALLGLVVENPDSVEPLNQLLHQYKDYIIGRMGLPYRQRGVSIISIVLTRREMSSAACRERQECSPA